MDRRHFLRLGAAAPLAVSAARHTTSPPAAPWPPPSRLPVAVAPIREITISDYMTSADHRALGDELMRRAGLAPDEVSHMELVAGTWELTVVRHNALGRPYAVDGELATRTQTVAA